MDHKYLFQLSLKEAGCFIEDCISKSLEHALRQGTGLSIASQLPPKEEKLLTTVEVCKLLHITRATCDTWRKQKKLPYKRIGSRVYFNEQEVLAALQSFNRRARS
jgi:excisionase family DNA binding protein